MYYSGLLSRDGIHNWILRKSIPNGIANLKLIRFWLITISSLIDSTRAAVKFLPVKTTFNGLHVLQYSFNVAH